MELMVKLIMEDFEEDLQKGLDNTRSNNYLIANDYVDVLSREEIKKAQHNLQIRIKSLLKSKNITRYKVFYDWCVHVIDKELYEKLMNENYDKYIELLNQIVGVESKYDDFEIEIDKKMKMTNDKISKKQKLDNVHAIDTEFVMTDGHPIPKDYHTQLTLRNIWESTEMTKADKVTAINSLYKLKKYKR